jgi:hypothetical protein
VDIASTRALDNLDECSFRHKAGTLHCAHEKNGSVASFVLTHIGQLELARNNSFCAPLSTTRHKFIQNGDKKRNNKQGDAH